MKSENRIPLTRLEACTLMAREAVSLLEGGAEALDSGTEFREALALLCATQDLGDGGALLAWVDAELECARRFAKTGEQPTPEQWQTALNAARMLTEMDGLEDMVLDTMIPDGGFLTTEGLRKQLTDVQAALRISDRTPQAMRPVQT